MHKDLYDGLDLRQMPARRLFSDGAAVGDLFMTNMQIQGQFPTDQTFVILAMRVRSNITRLPMTRGTKEVIRDAFLVGDDDNAIRMMMDSGSWERSDLTKAFDEWLHATTATVVIGQRPYFDMNLHDLITDSETPVSLNDGVVTVQTQDEKLMAFSAHRGARRLGSPLIVPVRQNFYVQLDSGRNTWSRLAPLLADANIRPCPMVWFHLEGLLSRDVA